MVGDNVIELMNHILFGCLIFSMFMAILFYFITVRRIEKQFLIEGITRPDWDGIGLRIPGYAIIILCDIQRLNDKNYPLLPVAETRRLATKIDRLLAFLFYFSAVLCVVILVVLFMYE